MENHRTRLTVEVAGIRLRNPVILASGTAGYMTELADAVDLTRVGAVVTKSITAESREGNEPWRVTEARGGMLNAVGLANVGMEAFRADYAGRAATAPTVVVGSIAGSSVDDYRAVARMFSDAAGIPAVELNVSCPNVKSGCSFGDTPEALSELVAAVRAELRDTRLFVKLPPVTWGAPGRDIVALAQAAVDAGADGLCVANTTPAMGIDVDTRRPKLGNVYGGLSGPAVHLIAVRLVHLVHSRVARDADKPVIGIGGVMTWRDAAEFILAGASAVQMGTALFANPRAPLDVVRGLERWVRRQGAASVADLVGRVELPAPAEELA